ncbi:hypothetical protein ES895_26895 [Bacillus sp. 007/AIA-02/001]|uniref:hypothetical protein n=1 Tax=Bacillus sp. 007/AIA-02/001 TaxID=2509009 RepID=UPI00107532E1|nr:hypothetical protein [Bacillus sp. 007/AIA-02/001]TFW48698.1 hypothetical protein ES895_26895 [Bacillus sp. 007/AIA-02/001]
MNMLSFEPFNPIINDMAIKFAVVLFVPLIIAIIIKSILIKFINESIANRISSFSLLLFMYYTFKFVAE